MESKTSQFCYPSISTVKAMLKQLSYGVLSACILISAGFTNAVLAESSVWKVDNGKHEIFLAGTLHVLKPEDFPLPEQFQTAFKQSDDVYFEVDMARFGSLEVQQKLAELVTWNDGSDLSDVLSPAVLEDLESQLDSHGIPIQMLLPYKAGPAAMTLAMLEMQKLGMSEIGVEEHFAKLAEADERAIFGLETVEQQADFLVNMGGATPDEIISYTIQDLEGLDGQLDDMREAWRSGNLQQLEETVLKEMREKYKGIYQELIVDRNSAWLPKIEELLDDPDTEMVMVGAGHLAGPDSVLKMLATAGYNIEQLD